MKSSRRAFLKSTSASLGVALLNPLANSPDDLEKTFAEIRANLLEMVNEERAVENLPTLEIDELATQVATKHAMEMAQGYFASHWGRDGLKPYHRYSFAGGIHATQENISSANNTWSMRPDDLKQDTAYLHVRFYQEKPPYDGHRRTILAPQNTHVGFGVAVEQLRLRLVELFVAKHVAVESIPRIAKPGAEIFFAGRMLNRDSVLKAVEVFYEPLPKAPELSWLREPRGYSLPEESRVLRPKVSPPLRYSDGSRGVIDVSLDGSFRAPVKLYKTEPGIYTIVAWIRNDRSEKAFAATAVCIRALR